MGKMRFEFQEIPGKHITMVALDSKLSDYLPKPLLRDGKLYQFQQERTIKDCRHIDGCIYFHLGRVTDEVMVRKIEIFQKLKKEKGWKQEAPVITPEHHFDF